MTSATDSFLVIFLALNVAFLVGTAVWFRIDHATKADRFNVLLNDSLVDEVQWQYSLRSNLLLFGATLAAYLLYIGESQALLAILAGFSIINVVTDSLYQYPGATIFAKVAKGHRIAAVVICIVAGIVFFNFK